jgi:hypothetical protein
VALCYLAWFPLLRAANSLHWCSYYCRTDPCPQTERHAELVAVVAAVHKIPYGWHNRPVKGVALFEGDTDSNHHGAQLSIHAFGLHQSSWKFCVYLGRTRPSARSCPRAAFARGKGPLSLIMLRNGFRCSAMCVTVSIFNTAALPFPTQKPYRKGMSAYSSFVQVSEVLTSPPYNTTQKHNTTTQHNTTQHNTTQHNTTQQHSTTQHNTAINQWSAEAVTRTVFARVQQDTLVR